MKIPDFFLLLSLLIITNSLIAQPDNDNCAEATVLDNPAGMCITLDNTGATADLDPHSCNQGSNRNVWFTFTAQHPDLYFSARSEIDTAEVMLLRFEPDACLQESYTPMECTAGPHAVLEELNLLTPGVRYWIALSFRNDTEGEYTVCFANPKPCYEGNLCDDPNGFSSAVALGELDSKDPLCLFQDTEDPFLCISGCTEGADGAADLGFCLAQGNPAVWYTFNTGVEAAILNIHIRSEEIERPVIQLYRQLNGTPCDFGNPEPLANTALVCLEGSGGKLLANATPIWPETDYTLVISSNDAEGGAFEMCLNAVRSTSTNCVTSTDILVTDRQFPGPTEGPFFPGEEIEICMQVNNFQVSTAGQGCQWFQGIVPVFGDGWSAASFDGEGQPREPKLNGNIFPAGNVYNAGQFDWWTNVEYHHPNCHYVSGDLDGNGTLDMCSKLYDPDCEGQIFEAEGCCGPCWNENPGNPLPPGWFTSGVTGSCSADGWPGVDWGDGNTCNGPTGPWAFCFTLTVGAYGECTGEEGKDDLSLSFFSFADGETGSWNGGPSVCALDGPAIRQLSLCCVEPQQLVEEVTVCSGENISFMLNHPDVDSWEWKIQHENTGGGEDGGSANPADVTAQVSNTSGEEGTVTYHAVGYGSDICPVIITDVQVNVIPEIEISFDAYSGCIQEPGDYFVVANTEGGSGTIAEYLWSTNSTVDTLYVSPEPGDTWCITVTDDAGCTAMDCVTPVVYLEVPVEITVNAEELCDYGLPVFLGANVPDLNPTTQLTWITPVSTVTDTNLIAYDGPGTYILTVNDGDGCEGSDTLDFALFERPEVDLNPSAISICPGQETTKIGVSPSGGVQPYVLTWESPDGEGPENFIFDVLLPGLYIVTVTDANGCVSIPDTVAISASPIPLVDLGPDTLESTSGVVLDAGNPGAFFLWNTGDTTQTIVVTTAGLYSVFVMNDAGCTATDTIFVDVLSSAYTPVQDEGIRIYPNPNGGTFNLECEAGVETVIEIQVLNAMGQGLERVSRQIIGQQHYQVDLGGYPAGVYNLLLRLEDRVVVRQVVVMP